MDGGKKQTGETAENSLRPFENTPRSTADSLPFFAHFSTRSSRSWNDRTTLRRVLMLFSSVWKRLNYRNVMFIHIGCQLSADLYAARLNSSQTTAKPKAE